MAALGPSGFNNGPFDVLFSPDNGKPFTAYYFSQSFVISRVARFRCGNGLKWGAGVELVNSLLGSRGVIQEDAHYTADSQYGGGTVDGCVIASLGSGGAPATPGASTLVVAGMNQDPGGVIPVTTWHVGDGIIATPAGAGSGRVMNESPFLRCSREPISAACLGPR